MVFITAIRTDSLFLCLTDDYRATKRKRDVFPGPHSREKVEQDLPHSCSPQAGVTHPEAPLTLVVGSSEQMQIPGPSQSLFKRNVGTHI